MESRYNVGGRSSLFSRRSNRTADGGGGGYDGGGGGGGMVVGARVGRYDRNRFAKLDLGLEAAPSPPTTLTAESYDSGRSLIDLGKLGLLGESGRVSRVYDGPPSLTTARTGGLLGRIGLPTYGNGITGNVGSILDTGITKPNDVVHRSDDAYDFGLTGTHDSGTYGTRYGGTIGTYNDGTTETFLRGTAGTYNETHNGTGETHYGGTAEHYSDDITGPYRSITGPSNGTYDDGPSGTYGERTSVEGVSSDDDVIYYHLIDNYTIFQLETVEDSMPLPSSKMTTPASTPPATPSALKPLGLSLSTIRGTSSGDLPVHKKLNLIKNLQILIEELQQKVTRLQIEVEEQDIATSFCNSKFGSNRSKDSATTCSSTESSDMKEPFSSISSSSSDTCDVNRCRHVDELQLLKKQNAALLQEKCHLEEQIVQLRSLKSIVHGTDSEKRVTKLEAENVQLQKQLAQTIDQLRQQQQQQHTVIPGGEGLRGGGGVDEESTYPNVASTVQQYESRKYETDSKVNGGGVERLKERQNLIDAKASSSFSSSSSTSQAAAAKHHSHLSSAAESLQLQQPSSLSASDAVNMDMYKRNLLADIGRLPQSVSAEVKRWTSDEGPEVDQDRDLGSCTEGNQMSLKEQTKDNMEAEARGIRVLCRLRPALKDEQGLAECVFPTTTTTTMTTDSPSSSSSSSSVVQLMYRGRMKSFEVDHIIPATDDSQQRVIDDLRGHVVSCIDGQSFNVIAYGETGSGKTFTIQGSGDKPGIVQRTTALLLDEVKRRRTAAAVAGDDDEDCQLTMSIIEIYNETIRDLLSSDPNHKVDMKPTPDGGAAIPGLTCIQIESGSDATKILKRGQDNRCSKQVAAADHSSRSHLIITIEITRPNRTNEKRIYGGRVNLIDLAGSERIEKTGVDAARFKEAQSINKSLTCLGDVLYALLARQTHVPFRSSKLTHLLQDAFIGPNSSTALIVHIASVEKRASETMSTLMFAQRVRAIEAAAAMTPHSSSVRGAGGPSSEGGSGSRTPVEPISQRPRRPSVSGISDRLSVFERRPSISRGPSNSPASAARRPSGAIASASAAAAVTAQARQRSKSRTENRITGGGGGKGGDGGGGGGGSGGGGSGSGGGAGGVVSPVASRPRSAMKCLPPTPKK